MSAARGLCACVAVIAVAGIGCSLPSLADAADTPVQVASPGRPGHAPVPTGADLASPYSRHVLRLVNEYRTRHGLPALEAEDSLRLVADRHSRAMAARGRISHDGFRERFDRTDSRICVENVGARFAHAEALIDGWRGSPAHHRNLLEPRIRKVGVAAADSYVTFFACG